MKKLISLGLMVGSLTVSAANYKVQPLLTGYNLYVTNATPVAIGGTNNEYTTLQGAIVYSLTNNLGNTNSIWADAFDSASDIAADSNGNINTNASIVIYINNTNWIPIAVTNSQGQYFPSNNWPLVSSQYPVYMYPATTNLYPSLINASSTNVMTLNFQRGLTVLPQGAGSQPYVLWETSTNSYSTTITGGGFTPVTAVVNPPANWFQGFNKFRLNSVTIATNSSGTSSGFFLNGVWFGQWVP